MLHRDEQKIKHIHLWPLEIVFDGSWRNSMQTSKAGTVLAGDWNRPALQTAAAPGAGQSKTSFLRTARASAAGVLTTQPGYSLHTHCHKNSLWHLLVILTNHCLKNKFKLCHFMYGTLFIMSRWNQSFKPASR